MGRIISEGSRPAFGSKRGIYRQMVTQGSDMMGIYNF